MSLTETFEAVVGVLSTIDPANAKDTTSAGLKTNINTVAAVEELKRDKVVLESKEDNDIVTIETLGRCL